MSKVVIIGGGPGGYTCAIRLAQLGEKVALVEKGDLGGVCLNIGCIPTKAYLHLAEILKQTKELKRAGIKFLPPKIELAETRNWVSEMVKRLASGIEALLRQNKCEVIKDEAEILPNKKIRLKKRSEVLLPENIVIATGSRPASLKELPFDGRSVISSDDALRQFEIPKSVAIIGGGAIGLEMATLYSRFGADLFLIEIMEQILPELDEEIASHLKRILEREGIKFFLASSVLAGERRAGRVSLRVRDNIQRKDFSIETDKVLVAVGRIPNTEDLTDEIKRDEKGFILKNKKNETNVEGIFAIGDCSGPPLLAHKAMDEGRRVAESIAGKKVSPPEPLFIPNCIYTDPEVAGIGLSEKEAQKRGYNPRVYRLPLRAIGRAHTLGRLDGLAKAIVNDNGELIGFFLLAPFASEMITEVTLMMHQKIKFEEIRNVIHPHPTISEILPETLEKILARGVTNSR